MSTSPTAVRWIEQLTVAVLARGKLIAAVCGLVTVASLHYLPQLEFDVSVESFLDPDDPDMLVVNEVLERFGSAVPLILAYRDPELFTPEGLARLETLTAHIANHEYVARAESLVTANVVTGRDDIVAVASLADPLPQTSAEAAAMRAEALGHRYLVGNLVSADGTAAAVVANLVYVGGHDDEYAPEVVGAIRAAAKDLLPHRTEFHLAGLPVFYEEMLQAARRDLGVLTVVPAILVLVLLVLLMRSAPGVALPLLVVGLTLTWTMGLMSALGVSLGVASILLPPLVLVIGCADAVHIVNQVAEESAERPDAPRADLITAAMGRVGLAVVLTSATTCVGFGSLTISTVRTVRNFGLFAAIAIVIALLLSLTLVPVFLHWWPLPAQHQRRVGGTWIREGLDALGRFNRRHPTRIIIAGGLVAALSVVGMFRIRVETGFREQFPEQSPIAQSLDFVEATLGGPDLLSIIVWSPEEDGILEPSTLRFLHSTAEALRSFDEVSRVDSIVDVLSDTRHVLDSKTPPGTYLPKSRAEAAQLMLLLEAREDYLKPMLTPERDVARISARFNSIPTRRAAEIVAKTRAHMAGLNGDGLRSHIVGPVQITQRLVNDVIDSQIRSFGLAFFLIFLMMAAALRSVSLAALSMVPNTLPIVIMLGVMGWADLPLNDVTIMTASIAIGIAVDDTIHYLVRFRLEFGSGVGSKVTAMERTVSSVGRALVITSVVLAAGFAVSLLASFKPPMYFGGLSVVAIFAALGADLVLLPAMLLKVRLRGIEQR